MLGKYSIFRNETIERYNDTVQNCVMILFINNISLLNVKPIHKKHI